MSVLPSCLGRLRWWTLALLALLLPPAHAELLVRARATGSLSEAVAGRVVVRLRPGLSEQERRAVYAEHGASVERRLPLSGLDVVTVPEDRSEARALDDYLADPRVETAEFDLVARIARQPDDPLYRYQAHLPQIACPAAWDGYTGSRQVIVAVIDSGVDLDHPDLAANLWTNADETANGIDDDGNGYVDDLRGWNFVDSLASPEPTPDGKDNDGVDGIDDNVTHGTMVAGCIAAVGANATGVAGVAWQARIMPLKVFPDDGGAELAQIAEAIVYATRNGAAIINLSIGGGYNTILDQAIDEAWARGVLLVVAAGNDNRDLDADPQTPVSNDRGENKVLGVAAVDATGRKAFFSDYGSAVDIAAPGVDILSTAYFDGSDRFVAPYRTGSGTSFASPIVAGVAALVKGLHPELDGATLRDRVLRSVSDIGGLNAAYAGLLGGGLVDARRAVTDDASGSPGAPTGPTPALGATGLGGSLTLAWDAVAPPSAARVAYDLYFGSAPTPPLVATGLTEPAFTVSGLRAGRDYRWQVVARGSDGAEAVGALWGFTAGAVDALEPDDAPASASALSADGELVRHTLTPGDTDYSRVRLETGVTYEFRTVCLIPGVSLPAATESAGPVATRAVQAVDTVLSLYDADGGILLAENDDARYSQDASSRVVWTCTRAGDYQLPVVGYRAETTGDYELTALPLGAGPIGDAPTPAEPRPADGALGVSAAPTLTCALAPVGATPTGVVFDIALGVDASPTTRVRGLTIPRLPLEGLTAGRTYTWQVTARDPRGRKTVGPLWRFSVGLTDPFEPDNTAAQARGIRPGGAVSQHALAAGDADWVRFSAVAGGSYTLRASAPAEGDVAVPRLEIRAADGTTVLAAGEGSVAYTATTPGILLARATASGGTTGFYGLALSGPEPAGLALTLSTTTPQVRLGEPLVLAATLTDDRGTAQPGAEIEVTLTGPAGRESAATLLRTGPDGVAHARLDSRRFGLGASGIVARVMGESAAATASFSTVLRATLPRAGGARGLRILASPVAGAPSALLGLVDPSTGRLAAYDPATRQYAVAPGSAVSLEPGRGYFAAQQGAWTLAADAGDTPDPDAAFSVSLEPGWNLIGNPFRVPVLWQIDGIRVLRAGSVVGTLREAAAQGLLEAYAWAWDGAADRYALLFDAASLPSAKSWLEPYEGAFLRANVAGLALALPAQSSVVATGRASAGPEAWSALRVTFGGGGEEWLYLAHRPSALARLASPPEAPGGAGQRASFAAGEGAGALACLTPGAECVLALEGRPEGLVTLSCPDLRALPRERSLVLHDTATGRSWDLRSSGAIPVSLGADGRRQLTLRCEALTDRLRVRVTESAWMRGEARIQGTLSRPADLLLEVENAAGRIVRRRSAGPRTAGPFELTWDGRDDRGTTLPSGRYALRLTATADDGQCATCRVEVTR